MKYTIKSIWFLMILLFFGCSNPKTATGLLEKGINEFNVGDYDEALDDLSESVKKDSSNPIAFYYKAMSEVKLEKKQEALKDFQITIKLDSLNFKAYIERGKLKNDLGDYVSAIDDCNQAMFIKKDYTDVYITKAKSYELLNDKVNAIANYEYAVKYGETKGELFLVLGKLYLENGNNLLACDNLRKAGEMGQMESFDLIKKSCNSSPNEEMNKSSENLKQPPTTNSNQIKNAKNAEIKNTVNSNTQSAKFSSDGNTSIRHPKPTDCKIKITNRPDGVTVKYLNPDMVGSTSNYEFGISISTNGEDYFFNTAVRYFGSAKKSKGTLMIELSNNYSLVLPIFQSEVAFVSGSECSANVYLLNKSDISNLKSSTIKKIVFKDSDGVNQIVILSKNFDLASYQLQCLGA